MPKSVKSVTELEHFIVAPGEFLALFSGRPPATGYAPPNSDSTRLEYYWGGGDKEYVLDIPGASETSKKYQKSKKSSVIH